MTVEHSKQASAPIVAALQNSGYYAIRTLTSETEAERALAQGDVLFVVELPANFDRAVDRGDVPSILIDADASDPSAVGNATAALSTIASVLNRDLPPVMRSEPTNPAFQFVIHARYNPEQLTVLNIVPGLICIVLMMSTMFMTTLSITREREKGTMENLLAMPVRPVEVMLAVQDHAVRRHRLHPGVDHPRLLRTVLRPADARLDPAAAGRARFLHRRQSRARHHVLDSWCRRTRCRRCSSPSSTLMPSFLLSGFMFPFRGMPVWAQYVGEVFPTTHAMRIVRGMLLKGNGLDDILPELWPLALFALVVIGIAVRFYRETLD